MGGKQSDEESLLRCHFLAVLVPKDNKFQIQEADEESHGGFHCVLVLRVTNWSRTIGQRIDSSRSRSLCFCTKDDEFRGSEADEGPHGDFDCVPVLDMTNFVYMRRIVCSTNMSVPVQRTGWLEQRPCGHFDCVPVLRMTNFEVKRRMTDLITILIVLLY